MWSICGVPCGFRWGLYNGGVKSELSLLVVILKPTKWPAPAPGGLRNLPPGPGACSASSISRARWTAGLGSSTAAPFGSWYGPDPTGLGAGD